MSLNKDVLNQVKQIEIQTRRVLSGALVGDYSSAQKGTGLEFDQIREYQMGDDVRFIDWKATARCGKLLVKQYIEERNRTVMLVVDTSGSTQYGSSIELKSQMIAQVASVLALASDYGKDHVGAIFCEQYDQRVFPPKQGRKYVHAIMEHAFLHEANGAVSLEAGLQRFMKVQKKDSIIFVLSDFFDEGYEKALKGVAKKHDVIAVRFLDACEESFPHVGLLTVQDPETGRMGTLKTGEMVNTFLQARIQEQTRMLRNCGVDILDLHVGRPFIGDVVRFFRKRMFY